MQELLLDVFLQAHLAQKHFNLILNMRSLKSLHQFVCGKYDVWRYAAEELKIQKSLFTRRDFLSFFCRHLGTGLACR